MSYFKGFGTGSNSNGQFWYGGSQGFPGFLYKKIQELVVEKIHCMD